MFGRQTKEAIQLAREAHAISDRWRDRFRACEANHDAWMEIMENRCKRLQAEIDRLKAGAS